MRPAGAMECLLDEEEVCDAVVQILSEHSPLGMKQLEKGIAEYLGLDYLSRERTTTIVIAIETMVLEGSLVVVSGKIGPGHRSDKTKLGLPPDVSQ